jgi:outer membrane protein
MNNTVLKRSFLIILIFILGLNNILTSQVPAENSNTGTDSLSLRTIIERVISSHPTVMAAEEAINNANARIGLAKTGYYPEVDMTANFANIGPVTKLSIPDMGTFQLYPANNFNASVNYKQVVYDFGRTRQNVAIESQGKALNEQTLEQIKQKLSLFAVNNFYTLAFLQAAIKIKDEQLMALKQHLSYVEKMMATGSATEYQVLSTRVKISGIESQKVDLYAALTAQQAALNALLGNDQSIRPVVRTELSVEVPVIPSDSVLSYAYHNRDEMQINEKKAAIAELRYDMVRFQNRPMVNFQVSGGAKNGYVPELNKIKANYVVGLGLRIPIFDAMKTKYNLSQAQSVIKSLSYESEFTRRNISTEISEAEVYMLSAEKKISQYELQHTEALKAYSLAEISFSAGVITNLDLLDSNTALSESSLLLLKARIDYAASIYKLDAAMGKRLYQ